MTKFKLNDKVKRVDANIYFIVDEVLPNEHYVLTTDMDGVNEMQYIISGDELELVRVATDPLNNLRELAIISFEFKEELQESYDERIDLCELVAKTEFPEYNQQLHFESDSEDNIIVVYVLL